MERWNPYKRYESFDGKYNRLLIENTSVCNFNCRHCAYGKKTTGKKTMSLEKFKEVVDNACEYGYTHFSIAPVTGEPLMDKGLSQKLEYLDNHDGVDTYYMFTNLSMPMDFLSKARKLTYLGVSIYGKDKEEFLYITRANERYFDAVRKNIKKLEKILSPKHIFFYTEEVHKRAYTRLVVKSELYRKIVGLTGVFNVETALPQHNWCGLVDTKDTGWNILPPSIEIHRPCYVMFCKNAVTVDGNLIGCGCFDANYETEFGTAKDFDVAYKSAMRRVMTRIADPICLKCSAYLPIDMDIDFSNTDSSALRDAVFQMLWKEY